METTTLLPQEARTHRERTGRPFVTLSYAQSLDGCIAAKPGRPFALSGPESLQLTHQLRAAHHAILVGIGTVLADDPRLNVRLAIGKNPQPIIIDSHLKFPPTAKLLQKKPQPWIITTSYADHHNQEILESAGTQVWRLPTSPGGRVNLQILLEQLGGKGVDTVMVEGGAGIITSFLQGQLVDYMILTLTPHILGGLHATQNLSFDSSQQPRLRQPHYEPLGEDIIVSGFLKGDGPCND